jgi:dTDP-4-dehydrorhamnose 3,5-epimerase
MNVFETNIRDLKIIQPEIYKDSRGYFFESYNSRLYKKITKKNIFVQDDHSFSKKNVLRGIHFQTKKPQDQLLYLVEGEIFICFIDLRPRSNTFMKTYTTILKSDKHKQIFQPAGVGSGYYVLSNRSHLLYKVSELYHKGNEGGIIWSDKDLKIKWPCKKPILSSNDKNNLKLIDINFNKYKDLIKL